MSLIIVDGILTDETYYLKNKNKETCEYCKKCKLKNGKNTYPIVGRCSINNLRKYEDEWCNQFDRK